MNYKNFIIKGDLTKKTHIRQLLNDNALVIIILLLIVFGSIFSETFLTWSNIKNLLYGMTIYGFLALGQSLVMLVSELNLTLGGLVCFAPTFGMFLATRLLAMGGKNAIIGGQYVVAGLGTVVICTLLTGALVGLVLGVIIVKFNVSSMVTTLGMMYALSGVVFFLFNGYALYLNRLKGANWLGTYELFGIPVSFVLLLIVSFSMIFFMKYTIFGRRIYATGGNPRAATYAGIDIGKWKIIAFTISGFFASIAGLIYSSRLESIEPTQGTGYQMFALAIAVVGGVSMEGGKGTLTGTLLATAIVSLVFNVMSLLGLYAWYQTMFIGAIILYAAIQQANNRKSLV